MVIVQQYPILYKVNEIVYRCTITQGQRILFLKRFKHNFRQKLGKTLSHGNLLKESGIDHELLFLVDSLQATEESRMFQSNVPEEHVGSQYRRTAYPDSF